jgi:Abnormal spindle-like microcephaly-assoc'd, ASPM-SPD-2-Hydin
MGDFKVRIESKVLAAALAILFVSSAAPIRTVATSCLSASGTWQSTPLSQVETGHFRISYDATPSVTTENGVVGLSAASTGNYDNFALGARFNVSGKIDARSGGAYVAASSIPYAANVTYHFYFDVNIANHTYSAYVTQGSVQQLIGANLAFRTTQSAVASLAYLDAVTNQGINNVCNVTIAPAITTQPAAKAVPAGQSASFSVSAMGTAPMNYQWSKNGKVISAATSANYSTPVTAITDNGAKFSVLVSNATGNVSSASVTMTVNAIAPSIAAQPASQTITAGQSATFFVAANGTAPFTYTWMKNGVVISGATSSSYATPVTSISDNGEQFTAAIGNSAGNALSAPAMLTVKAPATYLLSSSVNTVNFGSVGVSSNSTQNITLTNTGNANVTIAQVLVAGAGFNTSNAGGTILAPGQSTTITSTFSPFATGSAAGSITVSSNATNSPSIISLSGNGTAVSHSVVLSWTDPDTSVAGYNTYSSTEAGGPYVRMTGMPMTSPTYTDTTVQSGRTYYYVVTALDSSGNESANSTEVSALIP